MVESITLEKAQELSKGLYGELSVKYLSQYVVPFFFGKATDNDPIQVRNGSAFFVKTSKSIFAVTADHVIKECIDVSNGENFSCGLFPVNFSESPIELIEFNNIANRIIDRNEKRDIATFEITDDELNKLNVSVTSIWPPVSPEVSKGVGFCGFPSIERRILNDTRTVTTPSKREIDISFMVFPILAIADSVSDYQITYIFDWDSTAETQGFRLPPENLDLGGMSGGPALIKLETEAGIEHWGPGGVIIEGNMNPDLGPGRIIAARIDDCLSENGSISKT